MTIKFSNRRQLCDVSIKYKLTSNLTQGLC